jgi:hypothetical protein
MKLTNAVNRSASSRPASAWLAATRPLGRAALSCGLAGVLSLGAAGVALASGPDGAGRGASHGAERQGHASGQKPAKAEPQRTDDRQSGAGKDKTASQTRRTAKRDSPNSGTGSQHAATAHQQKSAPSPAPAPRRSKDPRGNNGTIKIDGAAWDARVDNEPHTSCAFRVTFFGFDEGQTADITVSGLAPTGGGVLLHETAVPTSGDRAGGAAHDYDGATRVFTADDLRLDAVTPHPKQGYHLKVTVDSLETPGGAKQKVLWLEPCGAQAPVTQPETGGFEEGGQPLSGAVPGAQPEVSAPAQAPGLAGASEFAPFSAQTAAAAVGAEAAFLGLPMSSASLALRQASPASVLASGQASALPSSLAFTGAAGLELLALTGTAAAAAGAGLLVARRRAGAMAG